MSTKVATNILAATGRTPGEIFDGKFNLTLSGTWTGTVTVQRSFDDISYHDCTNSDGTAHTFDGNATVILEEPEAGVYYRLDWTRLSGTLAYRISR